MSGTNQKNLENAEKTNQISVEKADISSSASSCVNEPVANTDADLSNNAPIKPEDSVSQKSDDIAENAKSDASTCADESSAKSGENCISESLDKAEEDLPFSDPYAAIPEDDVGGVVPEKCSGIPCPANGDTLVFTSDVTKYIAQFERTCHCRDESDNPSYAVLDSTNDCLMFVMHCESCANSVELVLNNNLPGFDSIVLWLASDKEQQQWLICTHLPISGRVPIPSSCKEYIFPVTLEGRLDETVVQAYDLTNVTTLRSWREAQAFVSPTILYDIIERIASVVEEVFQHGHSLIRISQDTIVLQGNKILFMGVLAMDMPWNERCAMAHHQVEYAAVPPECFGFLRKRMTLPMGVYVVGALAYYLVAGARFPTCESLGYDFVLAPRTFNPEFPLGWDIPIHRALIPNPETRYQCISDFVMALRSGVDSMYERRDFLGNLVYDAAVDTHIGVTKRLRCPVNQDAVFMRMSEDGQRILMVVADGVSTSTYGAGDIASHIVIDVAEKAWDAQIHQTPVIEPAAEISAILDKSNDEICQYIRDRYADKSPTASECMGTTALVAIIEDGVMTLGAIGDSRAYLVRQDSMCCITRDHNLFTIGIINGLPVEMCAVHPHSGSLVQCLGYYDEDEDAHEIAFDIYSMRLIPGDILMLTTDGILDYVACDITMSEIQIADTLRAAPNATIACLQLIMQANVGGGGDNCGVGIVYVSAG